MRVSELFTWVSELFTWVSELLNMELNLNWLRIRLPRTSQRIDDILDIAHFTVLVNGLVLVVVFIVVPLTFSEARVSSEDRHTISHFFYGPDLSAFASRVLAVSLPIWCLTFGIWQRRVISTFASLLLSLCLPIWRLTFGRWQRRVIRGRQRDSVDVGPSDLWDAWLDGPP